MSLQKPKPRYTLQISNNTLQQGERFKYLRWYSRVTEDEKR